MRRKMALHGDGGLDELPRAALQRLGTGSIKVEKEPPGGDAG